MCDHLSSGLVDYTDIGDQQSITLLHAMSDPPTSPAATHPREAALFAAQRRLDSAPAQTPTGGGTGPASTTATWTRPDAGGKDEREWKYKVARVLDKEVVGGNNYATAATCIEVGRGAAIGSRGALG